MVPPEPRSLKHTPRDPSHYVPFRAVCDMPAYIVNRVLSSGSGGNKFHILQKTIPRHSTASLCVGVSGAGFPSPASHRPHCTEEAGEPEDNASFESAAVACDPSPWAGGRGAAWAYVITMDGMRHAPVQRCRCSSRPVASPAPGTCRRASQLFACACQQGIARRRSSASLAQTLFAQRHLRFAGDGHENRVLC